MDLDLAGRSYVVTGGSSGIGLASAGRLVGEGANVLLVGRDEARLAAARAELDGAAGRVETIALDVVADGAAERLLGVALEAFDSVEGLVNGAGSSSRRSLEQQTDAEWDQQWELNVLAPKRLIDAFAPVMAAAGAGAVVNVCSSAGRRPSSTNPAYAVAKRGELALTVAYAERYAGQGLRIGAVAPGPTETPLWLDPGGLLDEAAAAAGVDREEALKQAGERLPIGRLAGAEEVADVVVAMLAFGPNGAAWSVDGSHVPDVFP